MPALMQKEIQLEIWQIPFNEEQARWQQICELKQTVNNIRRGLFRRVHELQDKVAALEEEICYIRREFQPIGESSQSEN